MTSGALSGAPASWTTRALVLGLGNLLCSDDGIGVIAVQRLLEQYVIPDDVAVLDGGTLGLSLLPHLVAAEHVLLLDAVRTGSAPGSLVRLEGDRVELAVRERLSVHQVGVADLLAGARCLDRCPRRLVLLGLSAGSTELGLQRSAAVEAQIPALLCAALAELEGFGLAPLAPRARPAPPAPGAVSVTVNAERLLKRAEARYISSCVRPPLFHRLRR